MIKNKLCVLFSAFLLAPCFAAAMKSDAYFIDAPSPEVLPARSLGVNARAFSGGGLLAYFDFAVTGRFSVGISETFEHLVGTNDQKIKLLVPALQAKFRIYDGNEEWPALAIGFDNQGFLYDHETKEYTQKARGLYLNAAKEVLIPGLVFAPGVNITVEGFEFDKLAAFAAASYNIMDAAALLLEWDNIRALGQSRLNGGLRVYLYEGFNIDFALRDFNNKAERILQLKYVINL
ncbi:MAG: hypothetical protein LBG16_02170 [Elusimicrobiota bacterium]|jgi:hypothetical protein|nr:hypothetical protein [Elusimicrobiota bacterium]